MNISLEIISDSDVRNHMWERRGDHFVHTRDPEFFPVHTISMAPPPSAVDLMRVCETDRVGMDFFGKLHPMRPSASYRAEKMRMEEVSLREQLEAAQNKRRLAEQEAYDRDVELRRHAREERIRREQAEAMASLVCTFGRGMSRIFSRR